MTTEEAARVPVGSLQIRLSVNGRAFETTVPVRLLLSDFLRERLGLRGTHVGCEHGVCGACTVLLDGEPVRSCITLAVSADGREVTTVEGLSPAHGLSDLQGAFSEAGALQCGFCTPGLLATISCADPAAYADDDAIRELIGGHLCRCTGYSGVVDAVRSYWGRTS
jgi:carbon-monoxide dehydrogenase small subunit